MNRSPTLDEDDVAEDFEKDEFTLREIINVKVSDFFYCEIDFNYCCELLIERFLKI